MGAFMKRCIALTSNFPAHMVAMHTAFPRFDVCSACPDIVLHTNGLVVPFSKLDCAPVRHLNLALA